MQVARAYRHLPPGIYAIVMATGIVSLALHGAGYPLPAMVLFGVNVVAYLLLSVLLLARVIWCRSALVDDLTNLAKAPGFFTLVAAPCVLGSQCVLLIHTASAGLVFWGIGLAFWILLTYLMLPNLMEVTIKPKLEDGLDGSWLLIVVGTQAISVLACLLTLTSGNRSSEGFLFVALLFWLVGSMLYIWLIALIFQRVLFLPLTPSALNPSYWISMGAVAISTLAGVLLVQAADRMPLLVDLLPFLKGMTLLFWATGSWWIPMLLTLGIWRHLIRKFPMTYEHGRWAVVFPLGMYTVCTQSLIREFHLPFLVPISEVVGWLALIAWTATFLGLIRFCWGGLTPPLQEQGP